MHLKRLKLILPAFLLILMVVFFFSCKKLESESKATADAKPSGAVKEKTYTITVNGGVPEDDKERLAEQELFQRLFHQRFPQIKLEFSTWQFTPESFIAKISAGTATDIIGVFATEGTVVIEKHLGADITDFVKNWELYPYINKEVIAPFTHEDRIYGVPAGGIGGGYVMTLFYNKDMFKKAGIVDENGEPKPPQTWEEFVAVAQKLTDRQQGVAGFGILGEAQGGAGWHFLNWVWQAGGDFEKKINNRWVAVFDSPEAVKALQFLKDLRWKYDVLQKDVTCTNDDLFQLFVSERIAMAIFTPEYLFYIVEKLKFPMEKIGITLLPAGPAGRANQMGGSFFIINPTIPRDKQAAAFNFITFTFDLNLIEEICKLRRQQGRLVGIAALPVFTPEYQQKIDAVIDKYRNVPSLSALMAESVKYVRPEPPYYCQALYREYLSPVVQKVLTDKNADPEKLLKEAAQDFQKRFLAQLKF